MQHDPIPKDLLDKVDRLIHVDSPRYRRLWNYYANPMRACATRADSTGDRPYRQAQEWGMPTRVTGYRSGAEPFDITGLDQATRKEVVIENDIAWRVETLVDYLFGKPIVIQSSAADPERRDVITEILRAIFARHGGITFFQQLALLSSVYGFVDVLVKFDCDDAPQQDQAASNSSENCGAQDLGARTVPPAAGPAIGNDDPAPGASHPSPMSLLRLARRVKLEIVEPARALPCLRESDWQVVESYGVVSEQGPDVRNQKPDRASWLRRLLPGARRDRNLTIDLLTRDAWKRIENGRLVESGRNTLGEIPLVHVQNSAVPFAYSGMSDVEPLIPLQDELNTRMSDRAYRIAMQSFKMFLGKGIDNFTSLPIGPGQMWMTDNPEATITEFGGDGKTFSEDNHIADVRQALDKTSGVTPIAAGALKGRIGRLTSGAALRVTMLALLAKTERKRTTFQRAIQRMSELALAWLDHAGVFATTPDERRIEIHWPSPIPVNEIERLDEARAKVELGIDRSIVLRELGYEPSTQISTHQGDTESRSESD